MMDEIGFSECHEYRCGYHEQGGLDIDMRDCGRCYSILHRLTLEKNYDYPSVYQVLIERREVGGCVKPSDCSVKHPDVTFLLKITDEFSITDEELSSFSPHIELLETLFYCKDKVVTLKAMISRDKMTMSQQQKGKKGGKSNVSTAGFDRGIYAKSISELKSEIMTGIMSTCTLRTGSRDKFVQGVLSMLADVIIMSEIEPLLITDSVDDKKPNAHVKSKTRS